MWETKYTLPSGLKIDHFWWAGVKVGLMVVVCAAIGIALGFAIV